MENKIKALIKKETDQIANNWFNEFATKITDLRFEPSRKSLPIRNTRDIYYARAKRDKANGNKIKGFEMLIDRLRSTSASEISIHKTEADKTKYFIFTDPEISELLGVLEIENAKDDDLGKDFPSC